jgi:hypothetical protein
MINTIICKKCGTRLDVSQELQNEIKKTMAQEIFTQEQQIKKMSEVFEQEKRQFEEQKEAARREYSDKLKADRDKISVEIQETQKLKRLLIAEKEELEKDRSNIEARVKDELEKKQDELTKEIQSKADRRASENMSKEMETLKELINNQKARIEAFQSSELELVNDKIKLQEREREIELKTQKILSEKLTEIRNDEKAKVTEELRLKELEKDKKIMDLSDQVDVMKRKLEQGSQKMQGDILEEDFYNELVDLFTSDRIQRVRVGSPGGDIIQEALEKGKVVGKIIWEIKNTKSFGELWIQKIRKDAEAEKADIAVIVTKAMPESAKNNLIEIRGDVIIAHYSVAKIVAALVRNKMIQIYTLKQKENNVLNKKMMLYDYILSNEFDGIIARIYETVARLTEQSNADRQFFERSIGKRQKHIEYILKLVTAMDTSIEIITDDIKEPALLIPFMDAAVIQGDTPDELLDEAI